jgi:hypothetical protein
LDSQEIKGRVRNGSAFLLKPFIVFQEHILSMVWNHLLFEGTVLLLGCSVKYGFCKGQKHLQISLGFWSNSVIMFTGKMLSNLYWLYMYIASCYLINCIPDKKGRAISGPAFASPVFWRILILEIV